MKTIASILNSVSDTIYERGEEYYRFGNILEIRNNIGDYFANVKGSNGESYSVNVKLSSNGKVELFDCDCPYDYSPICKHIVAVMLAIQNNEGVNVDYIKDRLNKISKDELINVLTDLCRDNKIKEKMNNRLNVLLNKNYDALSIIDSIIDGYSDCDGYINYYSCYNMCMEIVDVINNEYECFEKDNSITHIQNLILINRKLINIMDCCDDSDGGLSIALSEIDEKLHNACMTVYNSKDKENCTACLNMLCDEVENKIYDYWLESKFELIHIALLFSKYNSEILLKAIDRLIQQSQGDYEYYYGKAILLKFQFLSKTQSKEEAEEFIFCYADVESVCEFLVKRYIDEQRYDDAEQLCLDKLKRTDNKKYWNNLLSEIYETSEQFDKQLDIELNDLLSGNSTKYDIVKELMLKLGLWKKNYAGLIDKLSNQLPVYSYAEILEKEGEYEKLLDLVRKHRHLIERYFKSLVKKYPEEAYIMYFDFIVFSAKQASSRPEYQSVCQKIAVLYNEGGKEKAKNLIALLKKEYPHKPAFQDELNKISKRL